MYSERFTLPGSDRGEKQAHGVTLPRVTPSEQFAVTVWLKPLGLAPIGDEMLPVSHYPLDRPEYEPLRKLKDFAEAAGLVIQSIDLGKGQVKLYGTAAAHENAWKVRLDHRDHPEGGSFRAHYGPVSVPRDLGDVVASVLGLDTRPCAKPRYRKSRAVAPAAGWDGLDGEFVDAVRVPSFPGAFTPMQLAKIYDVPTTVHGAGETIGILELDGGYRLTDLHAYAVAMGLPAPNITWVSVDGAKNAPTGNPDGPDGEVMLDICIAMAIAPKAKIVVYFAPNTDAGFVNGFSAAINDSHHKPSVLSVSWGGPESNWTAAAMTTMNNVLATAATKKVTITATAGDDGSNDGVGDGGVHVDYPGSSPWVLCCGGTRTTVNGSTVEQVVWNDTSHGEGATGGGISAFFAAPSYQANLPGGNGKRQVPDVAANASPDTGWIVRVDSQFAPIGGTSASAPFWASLIALVNEINRAPLGFINPTLYAHPEAFTDVVSGNNGAYSAKVGYDNCTGLGCPIGSKLVPALSKVG